MAEKQTPIPAVTPSPDMTRLLLIDAVSGYPLKRTKSGMRIAKSWDGATDDFDRKTLKTNGYIAEPDALARLSASKFPDGSDDGIETVSCPLDGTVHRIARVEFCEPA